MTDLVQTKQINEYVLEVSLNRPEKLNALTKPMWKKLGSIFRDLKKNKTLRCVVLRGKGGKSFSPGNDIGEFTKTRSNSKLAKEYGVHLHGTLAAIQECPIPTVALIEGLCVGGGLEIAACCDLRICGNSSRFGVPIKRLGLTMAPRELQALLQLVGRSVTMEILLEGRIFNSEEAYTKGIVNRVVPDHDVEKETYQTVERICDGAPLVARWHKQFADELLAKKKISNKLNNLGYKCYDTKDFQIGYKSFLTKTKPNFKNK
jgi:enoyl-CoA hydratase